MASFSSCTRRPSGAAIAFASPFTLSPLASSMDRWALSSSHVFSASRAGTACGSEVDKSVSVAAAGSGGGTPRSALVGRSGIDPAHGAEKPGDPLPTGAVLFLSSAPAEGEEGYKEGVVVVVGKGGDTSRVSRDARPADGPTACAGGHRSLSRIGYVPSFHSSGAIALTSTPRLANMCSRKRK